MSDGARSGNANDGRWNTRSTSLEQPSTASNCVISNKDRKPPKGRSTTLPGTPRHDLLFTIYPEQAQARPNCPTVQTLQSRNDKPPRFGGAERDRTADPLLAKQVLSQLSYSPNSVQPNLSSWTGPARPPAAKRGRTSQRTARARHERKRMVGPGRFELPTSPLSGVRSNQLSYGPDT